MSDDSKNQAGNLISNTISGVGGDPTAVPDLVGRLLKGRIVLRKVDEGGFGAVYIVRTYKKGIQNLITDFTFDYTNIPEDELKEYSIMKVESNSTEGGCGLKIEVRILNEIKRIFPGSEQFADIFSAHRRQKYSYVFMTLLGKSLKQLMIEQPNNQFSESTWLRISIQGLYAVKQLHEVGFLHRDIKPANIVLGHGNDPKKCRFIHLIDFGLARQYLYRDNLGNIMHRMPRPHVDFRGTERYCSISMHFDKEQNRIDDVWSLLFTFIEMNRELPWSNTDNDRLEEVKKKTKLADILSFLPKELDEPLTKLNSLLPLDRPNYEDIYNGFLNCMKKSNYKFDDKYDWEIDIHPKSPSMEKFGNMQKEFKRNLLAKMIYPKEYYLKMKNPSKEPDKNILTDINVCLR
uniref:non-specific serine/threonine protein kinase n=1 Tax=Parastrongyloides trichosuri TaxID=131310 RepID=A0A0N5A2X0_PARTI